MLTVRTVNEEFEGPEEIGYACRLGDSDTHPAQTFKKTINFDPYQVLVEESTPNSSRTREWKNYEHYKAHRSKAHWSSPLPVYSEKSEFFPHLYTGDGHSGRFGVVGYYSDNNRSLPFGEPGLPIQGLPAFYSKRSDGGFVPPPDSLQQLIGRSMQSILPELKSHLSLINSLLELKDIKSLGRTLRQHTNILKSLLSKQGFSQQSTLSQVRQAMAGNILQVQFNIKPLISDIRGIYTALSRTERRINDLITREGTPQHRHFTWKWQEYSNGSEDSAESWPVSPTDLQNQYTSCYLTRQTKYDSSVFHVLMEYNFNYTSYQREHSRLLSLLDALGVKFDPSIIWNAIPWSFVVDWVIGVNRWLEQFTVGNMDPQINIRRCMWSIKRTRTLDMSKHSASVYPVVFDPPERHASMPRVTETSYRRATFMPGVSSIELSGLTMNEVTLGAALVMSRSRRRRKQPV